MSQQVYTSVTRLLIAVPGITAWCLAPSVMLSYAARPSCTTRELCGPEAGLGSGSCAHHQVVGAVEAQAVPVVQQQLCLARLDVQAVQGTSYLLVALRPISAM